MPPPIPIVAPFSPINGYWFVAGDASKVYSGSIGDYVPVSTGAYQSWLAGGHVTAPAASETDLADVLVKAFADGLAITLTSTSVVIQKALRQAELDRLLTQKVDNVNMVKGGQLQTLSGTGVANYQANTTNNYRALRKNITDATTAQGVRDIDINSGWPANP